MRSEAEAERAINRYADTVKRICFMHLKRYSDVEDVFQDVFLKYILYEHAFQSEEHEKAWIIRVSINACKDVLKSFFRRRVTSIDEACMQIPAPEEDRELLNEILRLPDKYRDAIYLHYYEGYAADEIADMLGSKPNTVYTWLARAREQLKQALGERGDKT